MLVDSTPIFLCEDKPMSGTLLALIIFIFIPMALVTLYGVIKKLGPKKKEELGTFWRDNPLD